jgi:hypothetical protein
MRDYFLYCDTGVLRSLGCYNDDTTIAAMAAMTTTKATNIHPAASICAADFGLLSLVLF